MKPASVGDTNFMLFRKGSNNKLGASVTYDAAARQGILNPDNPLRKGVTYKAVVTTFAQDLHGNRLDQSTPAGLQEKVWFFRARNQAAAQVYRRAGSRPGPRSSLFANIQSSSSARGPDVTGACKLS
jgi:hypothetical protein